MDTTVLVLGDSSDWDSYDKFCDQVQKHRSNKFEWIIATYDQLEQNRLPSIESDSILIYLFFPFKYWDDNIEYEDYDGLYGNVEFYNKFRSFWSEIHRTLKDFYNEKGIRYVNHPLKIAIDRDKEFTKEILNKGGVKVPRSFYSRDHKDILRLVNEEDRKLFLKVRYGSMGKGITYMEKGNWKTNFRFGRGGIISPHTDYGWSFIDITENIDFLKELLTWDIIIEEAIGSYRIDDQKFDLRLYTLFDDVLYIYPRTNDKTAITTNISQGAKGRTSRFLKKIPSKALDKALRSAVKTIKAVDVNFAGVDLIVSEDLNVYIIELNAFPGFPKVERFNLSKRIINRIEQRRWG